MITKFDDLFILAPFTYLIILFYFASLKINVWKHFLQLCPWAEVSTCFLVCSELVRLLLLGSRGKCRGISGQPAGQTVEPAANEIRLSSRQLGGGLKSTKKNPINFFRFSNGETKYLTITINKALLFKSDEKFRWNVISGIQTSMKKLKPLIFQKFSGMKLWIAL
jgi:hypothetical protein